MHPTASIPSAPKTEFSPFWEQYLNIFTDGNTLLGFVYRMLGEQVATDMLKQNHIRVVPLVLDTNMILKDLKRYVRTRQLTGFMQSGCTGLVRLLASAHVREEMLEHMPRVIKEADLQEVLALWEQEYAPWLHFLNLSALGDLTPRVAQLRVNDSDDVGTGILVELVCPPLLLSEDYEHLSDFGLLAPRDWTKGAAAYRDSAKSDGWRLTLSANGVLLLSMSVQASIALIPRTLALVKKLPWWVQLGAGAGIVTSLVHPTTRQWLKTHGGPIFSRIAEGVLQGSMVMAAQMDELGRAAKEAQQWLAGVQRKDPPMTTDLSAVMRVLATTPPQHLLTPTDIAQRMIAAGYKPRSAYPEIAVGRVLHRYDSLFEEQAQRRWQLRRA